MSQREQDDFQTQQIETEVATYLLTTPDFFDRHAELLSEIQLVSPHGKRAVSLQERQIELQRDKTKSLELKLAEMVRYAQENDALQHKLQRWVRGLLAHTDAASLPDALTVSLKKEFNMPHAAIKLWSAKAEYSNEAWALGASADIASFATSLAQPFCGPNTGYEAAGWLNAAASDEIKSLAMIPLHVRPSSQIETGDTQKAACVGLLVLGSPDAERFRADMGKDFLIRIGELTSSAVSRLAQAS